MKAVYDEFYKTNPCQNPQCKNNCAAKTEEKSCEKSAAQYRFEASQCNDSIIDYSGLAQAYVPFQTDFLIMNPCCSLVYGTVFPQLVQPYKNSIASNCIVRR